MTRKSKAPAGRKKAASRKLALNKGTLKDLHPAQEAKGGRLAGGSGPVCSVDCLRTLLVCPAAR